MKVNIAGLDGSLRNFGLSKMTFDLETEALDVIGLHLFETVNDKTKQLRKSSDLFERAKTIREAVHPVLGDVHVGFAEIPSGGQSYDAVIGFGIVIGLYASLPINLLEVSPYETKKATVGTRTASKMEMIEWAFETYPNASWLTTKRGGKLVPTQKNEHLADACAIVHAGIKLPQFRQAMAMLRPALKNVA